MQNNGVTSPPLRPLPRVMTVKASFIAKVQSGMTLPEEAHRGKFWDVNQRVVCVSNTRQPARDVGNNRCGQTRDKRLHMEMLTDFGHFHPKDRAREWCPKDRAKARCHSCPEVNRTLTLRYRKAAQEGVRK